MNNLFTSFSSLTWKQAEKYFIFILAGFLLLEVFLPPLCQWNFRSDVLEQIAIGHEWCLGSTKHPAATTWIARIFWTLTGHSDLTPYLASAFCNLINFTVLWFLGKEFLSPAKALFASLGMMTYWYMNMGSVMFNNNVTLMAFWLPSILFFWYALKKGQIRFWVLTGLCLGAGLNCKYTGIVLCLAMVLFLLIHRDTRCLWKTAGPWLTITIALLVFLPHSWFLWNHFDQLYKYTTCQKIENENLFLWNLVTNWFTQIGIVSPIFIALFPLLKFPLKFEKPITENHSEETGFIARWFLPGMFFLPMLVLLVLQFCTNVAFPQRSYGFHLWGLSALVFLSAFQVTEKNWHWKLSFFWILFFTFVEMISLVFLGIEAHCFSKDPCMRFYPGKALASEVDRVWEEHASGPCPFVMALENSQNPWNVAVYSRFQPRIITPIGFWASEEDLRKQGGILIWNKDSGISPLKLKERFPEIIYMTEFKIKFQQKNPNVPLLEVGVAVIKDSEGRLIKGERGQ